VDSARATIKKTPVPTPRVGRRGRERRVTLAESESESASSDSDSESAFESDETSENARACVRLRGMTTRRALQDASEARELVRDTREVCSDFGKVVSVFAPRPHPGGDPSLDPAGVGELYLRFDAAAGAAAARAALDGREFDGNVVRASFMSTALFEKTQKRAARAEEKNAPAKYKSSSRARAAEKNER
jgi:splicing factor U2AF subunit